jgi:hypothetical protein
MSGCHEADIRCEGRHFSTFTHAYVMSRHVMSKQLSKGEGVRKVERYLGGCLLACQRMREGKLMAPYCTREKKERKREKERRY